MNESRHSNQTLWDTPRRQRVLLLPGFGEDRRIFRYLRRFMADFEIVDVCYRENLGRFTLKELHLDPFVENLIEDYAITRQDLLVGHSMGGFLSHHIRQRVKCANFMIASFTDSRKLSPVINNKRLTKFFASRGWIKSFMYKQLVELIYAKRKSLEELRVTFEAFDTYTNEELTKQLKLILDRPGGVLNWLRSKPKYDLAPDMMVHPRQDDIVAAPEEKHIKVDGDHFALATHSVAVGHILTKWLAEKNARYRQRYEDYFTEQLWDKVG